MDREAWCAVVHGVTKNRTWLTDWTELKCKVKKLDKWVPHKLTANQKNKSFRSILLCNNKPFLYWIVMHDKKRILYDSSGVRLRRSSKALPKAKAVPHKGSWSLFGGLLLSDPLQRSESHQNHYIWEGMLRKSIDIPKTAMPATSISQQEGLNSPQQQHPTTHCTSNASKWSESHSVMFNCLWPHGLYSPWNSPGQKTGVVAFPFSKESSQPRDRTQVCCINAGSFFTSWAIGEAQEYWNG